VLGGCAVCGGDLEELFAKRGFDFGECRRCGHAQLDPLPTPDEAADRFGPGYFEGDVVGGYDDYDADAALHRRNARARLRRLGRPPGRLLDVGCASGYFLDEARRAGWAVEGVDVSPAACQRAARLGLPVQRELEAVIEAEPGRFDAITMFQVLEHTVDPATLLATAAEGLRPGGSIVLETWDRDSLVARTLGPAWQEVAPPTVLHLFGRRSLASALRLAGLQLRDVRRSAKWVSAGFVASLLRGARRRRGPLGRLPVPYVLDDLVTARAYVPSPAGR
jgi:SAM-dependent methyltransferase